MSGPFPASRGVVEEAWCTGHASCPSIGAAEEASRSWAEEPDTLPEMRTQWGWAIVAISTSLLLITTFVLRQRISLVAATALWAFSGLGLGLGGVVILDDPEPSAWIVAPLVVGLGAVAHMRALWAGEGPLRT